MKIKQLIELVEGEVLTTGLDLNRDIRGGCGADLMSDVLAYISPDAVLLTGLCSAQVVRTAQMADISAIVFVRGKRPSQDTVELANREGIPLITSRHGMFELCGRLYKADLRSLESPSQGQ